MLDSVYRICGVDTDDVTTTLATKLLNRSWWEIQNKFKFREKDTVLDFPLVIGSERYEVPDKFDSLRSIAVYDNDNKSHYIERVTSKWYEENYDTDTDARGFPTHYFREGSTINLYPTPDAAYNMVVRYAQTLDDLSLTNDPSIPKEWHEIILYGGCWRLLLELGDFQRCNGLKTQQIALIQSCVPVESKEMSDSRYSGLEFKGSGYNLR